MQRPIGTAPKLWYWALLLVLFSRTIALICWIWRINHALILCSTLIDDQVCIVPSRAVGLHSMLNILRVLRIRIRTIYWVDGICPISFMSLRLKYCVQFIHSKNSNLLYGFMSCMLWVKCIHSRGSSQLNNFMYWVLSSTFYNLPMSMIIVMSMSTKTVYTHTQLRDTNKNCLQNYVTCYNSFQLDNYYFIIQFTPKATLKS